MYCNKEVPEIISNVDTNLYDFVKLRKIIL